VSRAFEDEVLRYRLTRANTPSIENFPTVTTMGVAYQEADGPAWLYQPQNPPGWQPAGGTPGIPDAPMDGASYVRTNGEWTSGGIFTEASAFTGGLTATTPPTSDNSTNVATTAFVDSFVAGKDYVTAAQAAAAAPVQSVAGRTGAVTLTHSDITDWATATSSFATQAALANYLPLAGGTVTGQTTFNAQVGFASSIGVAGPITANGALNVSGVSTFYNNVLVSGSSNITVANGGSAIVINPAIAGQYSELDICYSDSGASGGGNIGFAAGFGNWRWYWASTGAESGSNTGSDFQLQRYLDDGGGDTPITVTRATGLVTIFDGLAFGNQLAPGGPQDLSKGLAFFGTNWGIGITSGQLNYNAGMHVFYNQNTTPAIVAQFSGYGTLLGTNQGDNALAGFFGEAPATSVTTSYSLTSGTAHSLGTLPLTAGDWDVEGVVVFTPAATTTVSMLAAGVSRTTNALPTAATIAGGTTTMTQLQMTFTTGAVQVLPTGCVRVNVSAATSVYLVAEATFATSTMGATGYISARRAR
jgi:hypothetical protein